MTEPGGIGAELYLDLLKKVLTREIVPDRYRRLSGSKRNVWARLMLSPVDAVLTRFGLALCRSRFDRAVRHAGADWPPEAETMIGRLRLDNLHECVVDVLAHDVSGDFIETGVWRGGACIFMRAALKAYGDSSRAVWAADSFEGFPRPRPEDGGSTLHRFNDILGVSLQEVKDNFQRYGLLDDQVKFIPGWFKDSLPTAPITQLAILRLDSDWYSSTIDALTNLYPKLSPGGYVIVDDYGAFPVCRQAIHDFRAQQGISEPLQQIDATGVFWQRQS